MSSGVVTSKMGGYLVIQKMKGSSEIIIFVSVLLLLIPMAISSSSMAGEVEKSSDGAAAVHIVYVSRPEGEDVEAFHIKTLASVLGSEEPAREAFLHHYTHAASGFSAKLTPNQAGFGPVAETRGSSGGAQQEVPAAQPARI